MEERPEVNKEGRVCSVCNVKPTISDSSPYCAACMGKKGNEKRRQKAVAPPEKAKIKKMKKDTSQAEKAALRPHMTVCVDFNKYPHILKSVEELANDQIRPVDAQIIFLLKSHFNQDV